MFEKILQNEVSQANLVIDCDPLIGGTKKEGRRLPLILQRCRCNLSKGVEPLDKFGVRTFTQIRNANLVQGSDPLTSGTKKERGASSSLFFGAGDRGRTDTVSLPLDFESSTSANSITPAYLIEQSVLYHKKAE